MNSLKVLFSLIIFLTLMNFKFVSAQDLNEGLVLHLPFEGNLEDAVGDNNGYINYFYETKEVEYFSDNGIVGQYGYFDSTLVDVDAFAGLEWENGSSFSIQYWMRDNEHSFAVIVGRDESWQTVDTASTHWWTGIDWAGQAAWFLRDNTFTAGPELQSPDPVSLNEWHLLTSVRDGAANMELLYVDNELVISDTFTYAGHHMATDPLNIGYLELGDEPGFYYSGDVDEVRIYNRALTVEDVLLRYNTDMGIEPDLNEGLVLHLPFEGNLEDAVGDNDGYINYFYDTNEVEYFSEDGIVGQFGYFENSLVNVDAFDGLEWENGSSFSIQYWMRDNEHSHAVIVGRDESGLAVDTASTHWWVGTFTGGYAAWWLRDNKFIAGPELLSPQTVDDGEWHLITAVRDGSANMELLYIDNELAASDTFAYEGHHMATDPLNIGYLEWGDTPGAWNYSGDLDEVRIYDRALTAADVLLRYNKDKLTSIKPSRSPVPEFFILHQNYPNPFNPDTKIKFDLEEKGFVKLGVYSLTGQRVAELSNRYYSAGSHEVVWNGRTTDNNEAASGIYVYQMEYSGKAGQKMLSKKMILMK